MANYASTDTFFEEVFPGRADVPRSGVAAPLVPVSSLMAMASRLWGGAGIGFVKVANPGDSTATITITRAADTAIAARGESMVFAGPSGTLLDRHVPEGGALATQSVMVGLHAGRYAGWGLRWLYFLSGIGGTIMVGSGLVLWTVKRRAKLPDPAHPHFGFRLVERLNVAAIAGLPAGLAAYFLANRLLPIAMDNRAEWEINSLFLIWAGVLLWACLRPQRRAWVESLSFAAALFAAVPIVNALTVSRNMLTGLVTGDWLFVAFDMAMVTVASALAWSAHKAARAKPNATRGTRQKNKELTTA
jgi:hypothetical protein